MPDTLRSSHTQDGAISVQSYTFLQRWIHRESGILLDESKGYLLKSRLTPIVEREALSGFDELCTKLAQGTPGYSRQVIEAMTTHETLFFRDHAPFEALRSKVLPQLFAGLPRGQKLQIWSAAASSGQEVYSIAMLLLEMGVTSHEVSILGTDLSDKVLTRARSGIYGNFEVNRGLPPNYLQRYFQPVGNEWRVCDAVRQMVRFEQMDLRQNLRNHGPFDVIFCRNVLIYFDQQTKDRVIDDLHRSLTRRGYLFLGAAENVGQHRAFRRVQFGDAIAYEADKENGA
ncbi:CheR family methyltransferase [Terriglobus sp. ADX1]|uniref:CheR family methyltransferase n=1 Tax=Terriglobus sp. ADX1 TaxID=2794063 RepID=UPI002FE623C0